MTVSAGSNNCMIHVWDTILRAQIHSLISPPLCQDVISGMSVAISSDSTSLVSCSGDQGIHMWDISSGINTLEVVELDTGFLHLVIFSPDNRIIVSGGGDGAIR
jgi:WD40 repeat protein